MSMRIDTEEIIKTWDLRTVYGKLKRMQREGTKIEETKDKKERLALLEEYKEKTRDIQKALATIEWGYKVEIPIWKLLDETQIKYKQKSNLIIIKGCGIVSEEEWFSEIQERMAIGINTILEYETEEGNIRGESERRR